MMKYLAVLGIVALGGCATIDKITSASIPQKQVYEEISLFSTAEQGAAEYLKEPVCATGQTPLKNACRTQPSSVTVASYVRAGRKFSEDLDTASRASADHSVPATSAAWSGLTSAVSAIKTNTGK